MSLNAKTQLKDTNDNYNKVEQNVYNFTMNGQRTLNKDFKDIALLFSASDFDYPSQRYEQCYLNFLQLRSCIEFMKQCRFSASAPCPSYICDCDCYTEPCYTSCDSGCDSCDSCGSYCFSCSDEPDCDCISDNW